MILNQQDAPKGRLYPLQVVNNGRTVILVEHDLSRQEKDTVASWKRCQTDGCLGSSINGQAHCIAHVDEDALAVVTHRGGVVDVRGVNFDKAAVARFVGTPFMNGKRIIASMMLDGCTFSSPIEFSPVSRDHPFGLLGATIAARVSVAQCELWKPVWLKGVRFDRELVFEDCVFRQDVHGSFLHGGSGVQFTRCNHHGEIWLSPQSPINVGVSHSILNAELTITTPVRELNAEATRFETSIDLEPLNADKVSARGAVFGSQAKDVKVRGASVCLEGCRFESRVDIELIAGTASLSRALFEGGGLLLLRGGSLCLSRLQLRAPLRVLGEGLPLPAISDLRYADAGQLNLTHVDLSRCSFFGAHNLSALYLDSTVKFAVGLDGRRRICDQSKLEDQERQPDPSQNITSASGSTGLREAPVLREGDGPGDVLSGDLLTAHDVSSIYRELRRGFEGRSDMAGAADFYFGEMSMRRLDTSSPWVERWLVEIYLWLSAYGTRPGRAFGWWLSIAIVGVVMLFLTERGAAAPSGGVVLVGLRAALPTFALQNDLTDEGRWVQALIRVLCTISLTMTILAMKSVIMRKPSE